MSLQSWYTVTASYTYTKIGQSEGSTGHVQLTIWLIYAHSDMVVISVS